MKTIKPVIAPFMALFLAMFWVAIPAQAATLSSGGYHDDGVSNGQHYFEVYWYSSDPNMDCDPTSGTDGEIDVALASSYKVSGGGWVLAGDVYQSWAGQSGFSQRECQVNVYAVNGLGQRSLNFGWTVNGNTQPGQGNIVLTF